MWLGSLFFLKTCQNGNDKGTDNICKAGVYWSVQIC